MAAETAYYAQYPNPHAPFWHESDADGYIDGDEPEVACGTVENTSKRALLIGETCQLTVAAVVHIRPNEQQNTYDVDANVVEAEADAGSYAKEY